MLLMALKLRQRQRNQTCAWCCAPPHSLNGDGVRLLVSPDQDLQLILALEKLGIGEGHKASLRIMRCAVRCGGCAGVHAQGSKWELSMDETCNSGMRHVQHSHELV